MSGGDKLGGGLRAADLATVLDLLHALDHRLAAIDRLAVAVADLAAAVATLASDGIPDPGEKHRLTPAQERAIDRAVAADMAAGRI